MRLCPLRLGQLAWKMKAEFTPPWVRGLKRQQFLTHWEGTGTVVTKAIDDDRGWCTARVIFTLECMIYSYVLVTTVPTTPGSKELSTYYVRGPAARSRVHY